MEKTTLEAAGPYKGDFVDPETATWDFRSVPGIYLRLRVEDAKDVALIRKKADDSARDSFIGCLLRENNPTAAATARGEADAGSGSTISRGTSVSPTSRRASSRTSGRAR